MEISNEELFQSALSDEAPEVMPQQEVTESEQQGDTRARDDQGRFVSQEQTPPKPEAEQQAKPEQKEEAQVPSWRLRELREAREAAERRATQLEQQLLALRPKPEQAQKPDLFEKPDEFVRSNVQEALSPIEQKFSNFIETVSRRDAIREHGEERVTEAYSALDKAAKSGDPQALAVVQAVKQSMDPFGDIARWYAEREASLNPQAYFQRQLDEALKDEKFRGELLSKLQPAPSQEKPKPVFSVPPSLNRAAAAAPAMDEGGDFSNESLFANAMR